MRANGKDNATCFSPPLLLHIRNVREQKRKALLVLLETIQPNPHPTNSIHSRHSPLIRTLRGCTHLRCWRHPLQCKKGPLLSEPEASPNHAKSRDVEVHIRGVTNNFIQSNRGRASGETQNIDLGMAATRRRNGKFLVHSKGSCWDRYNSSVNVSSLQTGTVEMRPLKKRQMCPNNMQLEVMLQDSSEV